MRSISPLILCRAAVAGLLVFWLAGILRAFCSSCLGPDEVHYFTPTAIEFAGASHERGWLWLLFGLDNRVGYGASYWAIYSAFVRLTTSPVAWMRGVAVLCWIGVPAAILGGGPRGWTWTRLAATALYISTPMAWWTAKLSGPEYISVGLAFWGILIFQRRGGETIVPWQTVLGGLFVGLATGIKLSTAPLLVFAVVWCACQSSPRRRLAWLGLGIAAGVVLSNPFLLVSPQRFFANLSAVSKGSRFTLERLYTIFTIYFWHWDGVYCCGWLRMGYAFWPTILIAGAMTLGRLSWREVVPLAITFAAMVFLLLSNGVFFGWYWFAVIPLLPLALTRTAEQPPWRMAAVAGLALLAAGLNVPGTVSMNNQQRRQLRQHEETLRTLPEIRARLELAYSEASAKGEAPILILNHLVPGADFPGMTLPIARRPLEPYVLASWIDEYEPNHLEVWMIVICDLVEGSSLRGHAVYRPISAENPQGYRSIVYDEGLIRVYSYRIHSRQAETVGHLLNSQKKLAVDFAANR